MRRFTFTALAVLLAAMCLVGCAAQPHTVTAFLLDTTCSITVYDTADKAAADSALTAVAADEKRWSRTDGASEISRLNRGDTANVSDDTAALLRTALMWSERTDGAFDITTAPLTDAWKTAEQEGALPSDAALQDALTHVGFDRLTLSGNTVTLKPGITLDLGAIAKGAIADRAAAQLRKAGCDSALIDLGGNIVAVGHKRNGAPFAVGITDPQHPEALIATVLAADSAVVTSGSYERGYQIGDTWYSHILDPKTGKPVQNDLLSVTILTASAADADALSTACFVMGYTKATALIDTLEGVEAVFVLTDGSVQATAGVQFAG